jgi:hypothetical protein
MRRSIQSASGTVVADWRGAHASLGERAGANLRAAATPRRTDDWDHSCGHLPRCSFHSVSSSARSHRAR